MNKKALFISTDLFFLENIYNNVQETLPNEVDFVIISNSSNYTKNLPNNVKHTSDYYGSVQLQSKINQYSNVIVLGLLPEHVMLINNSNKRVSFTWIMLGADGLYINKFKNRWYSLKTRNILKQIVKKKPFKDRLVRSISNTFLYEIYYLIRKNKYTANREKMKAIRRIDFIAPVIEDDYHILRDNININAQLIPFSISSLKTLLIDDVHKLSDKNSILLGNSADPSNNHIDVLDLLKDNDFDGNIICPLSYGNEKYKEIIIRKGKKHFGEKFVSLINFIPKAEYQGIINSCGIVVMNHLRQQAMGNIISALYQGKKVFLNDNNYTNAFFKRLGVKVYSFQDEFTQTIQKQDYTENDMIIFKNRMLIEKYYKHEAVLLRTKSMVKAINNTRITKK